MNRGYAAIGLYNPIDGYNIGGAMRAVYCYDGKLIVVQKKNEAKIKHHTDTCSTWRHIPVLRVEDMFTVIPYSCVPVAVEIVDRARSLVDYTHPERAFYIFGPENGTLPNKILDKCRDIVSIPTKSCMNLAATVNVVLYDRTAKEKQ